MAGIRSKKLKYANTLASLPKQVLRDILDMINVCNESDEPFDYLKTTLLGKFGKSKWQTYFELLHLPIEMRGLKPSVLMGKLKQHLPPGVSPDNDLFLAMFLVRLPPSMHETVGASKHMTARSQKRALKREEERARKKRKRLARKKKRERKSANSHFFLLPQWKTGFRAQSRLAGGESKGLE